ncbi:hypothetical protein F4824DRAFT_468992, partial [Ustulina deusta]
MHEGLSTFLLFFKVATLPVQRSASVSHVQITPRQYLHYTVTISATVVPILVKSSKETVISFPTSAHSSRYV